MSARHAVRDAVEGLERAGSALRDKPGGELVENVVEAWWRIADPERALGRRAREELPESTGLSLEMIAWTLAATFEHLTRDVPDAARRMRPPPGAVEAPHPLGALVLAGNVYTACVQPLTFSLLARVPTLVKASSRDDAMPRLFTDALREVDEELAAACAVVTFPGGNDALEAPMLSRASVVNAYGSDSTLTSLRARAPIGATFVGHGHGLGVGYVSAEALAADPDEVARRFALDVAAYDQRGCMSPHAILVASDAAGTEAFARRLSAALDATEHELPRGSLPGAMGPAQIQWRGVAAASGALFEGRTSAVALAARGAAIRPSPGWRNVLVLSVRGEGELARHAEALGTHLKVVGVAGDIGPVVAALPRSVAPRVCPAGAMQRPGLLSLADGRLPWAGLTRFLERPEPERD